MSDHIDDAATPAAAPLARAIASILSTSGVAVAAAAGLTVSPAAMAATYQVSNLNDSGSGSLRDAISQANSNSGDDIVTFASNVTGTITLTSGSIYIYDGVDIQGPGASVLTIMGSVSGNPPPRPAASNVVGFSDFVVNGGGGGGGQSRPASTRATRAPTPVVFSGVTIAGGSATNGGGINAYNALVTVNNCVVTGNYASQAGGGIYISSYYSYYSGTAADSALTVNNSTISNNAAYYAGGAIATRDSKITIQQSSVIGNAAYSYGGGGIFVHNDNDNALTIASSTVSGNTANGHGGGIFIEHTGFDISNSTLANNVSNGNGGGLYAHTDDYSATIGNSTLSGNASSAYGGGIFSEHNAHIVLNNTVVAGNTASGNDPDTSSYGGGTFAAAFSLIGNTGGATIADNGGNLMNVAAQLGALANNGGPTQTMLPLPGSPLINAGDPAFSGLANDQRGAGFPRIVAGRVDIGAVEGGAAVAATATPTPALGLGGKLGLGALLGLAGLAVARRRRNLGGAAGLLLAAALSVSAPNLAQAAQGHEVKSRIAATITSYSVQDKTVTLVLSDGQTLTAKKWQVHTIDRRSSATSRQLRDPSSVASGTPAAVSYETGKKGQLNRVRVRLVDTLQQAQALIARKP